MPASRLHQNYKVDVGFSAASCFVTSSRSEVTQGRLHLLRDESFCKGFSISSNNVSDVSHHSIQSVCRSNYGSWSATRAALSSHHPPHPHDTFFALHCIALHRIASQLS